MIASRAGEANGAGRDRKRTAAGRLTRPRPS
jgi:hypothetical protein